MLNSARTHASSKNLRLGSLKISEDRQRLCNRPTVRRKSRGERRTAKFSCALLSSSIESGGPASTSSNSEGPQPSLDGSQPSSVASIHLSMSSPVIAFAQTQKRPPSHLRDAHATSILREPATTRSAVAVASPARKSSTICSTVKPCAIISTSAQPSWAVAQMAKRGERGIGEREHAPQSLARARRVGTIHCG